MNVTRSFGFRRKKRVNHCGRIVVFFFLVTSGLHVGNCLSLANNLLVDKKSVRLVKSRTTKFEESIGEGAGVGFPSSILRAIFQQLAQTRNNYFWLSYEREGVVELIVNQKPNRYYKVRGETAAEAMRNANASTEHSSCNSLHQGCVVVDWKPTDNIKPPMITKRVIEGFSVTEKTLKIVVYVTMTMYLPEWEQYKPNSAEGNKWEKMILDLEDHENGHIQITNEEAALAAEELRAALLPAPITFIFKSEKAIDVAIKKRYSGVSKIARDAYSRFLIRDREYDKLTEHGNIHRSKVKY